MVRNLKFIILLALGLLPESATSRVIQITSFDQLLSEIDQKTLILLDIDHTLIESSLMLGSQPWNHYLKSYIESSKLNMDLYGHITFWIAQHVPVKSVEKSIPKMVQQLISTHMVLGFTARGRDNWNDATIPDVDKFTSQQLDSVGIHLLQPLCLTGVSAVAHGVIFTSQKPKGPVLEKFLEHMQPRPTKIVFVDDNLQQVASVAEAMSHYPEITFIGCHYTFLTDNSPSVDLAKGNEELYALIESILGIRLLERSLMSAILCLERVLLEKVEKLDPISEEITYPAGLELSL